MIMRPDRCSFWPQLTFSGKGASQTRAESIPALSTRFSLLLLIAWDFARTTHLSYLSFQLPPHNVLPLPQSLVQPRTICLVTIHRSSPTQKSQANGRSSPSLLTQLPCLEAGQHHRQGPGECMGDLAHFRLGWAQFLQMARSTECFVIGPSLGVSLRIFALFVAEASKVSAVEARSWWHPSVPEGGGELQGFGKAAFTSCNSASTDRSCGTHRLQAGAVWPEAGHQFNC